MENINTLDIDKLLKDKRVVAEIQRHLWIESEKAGYDIGFEKAKEDWLKNFSTTWMKYHLSSELLNFRKVAAPNASSKSPTPNKTKEKKKSSTKRRRAKSYL